VGRGDVNVNVSWACAAAAFKATHTPRQPRPRIAFNANSVYFGL